MSHRSQYVHARHKMRMHVCTLMESHCSLQVVAVQSPQTRFPTVHDQHMLATCSPCGAVGASAAAGEGSPEAAAPAMLSIACSALPSPWGALPLPSPACCSAALPPPASSAPPAATRAAPSPSASRGREELKVSAPPAVALSARTPGSARCAAAVPPAPACPAPAAPVAPPLPASSANPGVCRTQPAPVMPHVLSVVEVDDAPVIWHVRPMLTYA